MYKPSILFLKFPNVSKMFPKDSCLVSSQANPPSEKENIYSNWTATKIWKYFRHKIKAVIPAFTPAKSLPIPSPFPPFEWIEVLKTIPTGCNYLPKQLLFSAPLFSESDHHYMQGRKMIKEGYRARNVVLKWWLSS